MLNKETKKGYFFAIISYIIWGLLPIYWHYLYSLNSIEILSSRIVMATVTSLIFLILVKNLKVSEYIKNKKIFIFLILNSILLGINWGVYVYAVSANIVVQASLGYFINPIVSVLFGVIILKEKLDKYKIIALILTSCGVIYMAVSLHQIPYISLILAFTFGLYGLMKKKLNLDSLNSLLIETSLLVPIVLVYNLLNVFNNKSNFSIELSISELLLILFAGVVTVVPLFLFNESAKKIPLSSLGILQYCAPTMMLIIGVIMFDEVFTMVHAISFVFIWSGCILYIISLFNKKSSKKQH